MKRALFAIASVGIVATAIGVEVAQAQYSPTAPAYTPPPAYGRLQSIPVDHMAGRAMATAQVPTRTLSSSTLSREDGAGPRRTVTNSAGRHSKEVPAGRSENIVFAHAN